MEAPKLRNMANQILNTWGSEFLRKCIETQEKKIVAICSCKVCKKIVLQTVCEVLLRNRCETRYTFSHNQKMN